MTKEIPEAELVQIILRNASNYSPLIDRLETFSLQRRPWFMRMKGLQRAVTFDDIREFCDRAVYKTFAHNVFKQIAHEYFVNTRTGRYKHWFHLPSNSVAKENSENVKVTSTYAEFGTPNGSFHFTFPDRITYEWKGNDIVPSEISKVRFDMTSGKDISETLGKLENVRAQLEKTNNEPEFIREFIFGTYVRRVEDLAGVNLTITVPKDCPLSHPSFCPVPVTRKQIEQTVTRMFNKKLEQ